MTLLVQRRARQQLAKAHYERELALRLDRGENPNQMRIHSIRQDEPVYVRFRGRAGLSSSTQKFEGVAELLVTRFRLLLLVHSGMNARGLNQRLGEVAFVSVDRADLRPPEVMKSLLGKIKRVEFSGLIEPFVIQVPFLPNFEDFLERMTPEHALKLGNEQAAEIRAEARLREALALEAANVAEAEHRRVNAERFGDGGRRSAARRPLGPSLGILDHRKTWRYKAAASTDQCVTGFVNAFSSGGGLLARAKWDVARTPNGANATYRGRKGLVVVTTALSQTAQAEERGAVGSEVRFEIEEEGDGFTICAMWLASGATRMGFTNDARFFRPYMRAVEAQLRQVDPGLQVVKD